jgi:hypothetical protein
MITEKDLKELAQNHANVPVLTDILKAKYLEKILEGLDRPTYYESHKQYDVERFYYYSLSMGKTEYTEEQRAYILKVLDYVKVATWID